MSRRNYPNRTKSTRHRDPQANYRRAVERSRLARRAASTVSLKAATPGTVVWAIIPFRDNPADGKYRPAVVLRALSAHDLLVMPLYTSHGRLGERPLMRWEDAGMSRPVAWKPTLVTRLDRGQCSHIVGAVGTEDLDAMTATLADNIHLVQ